MVKIMVKFSFKSLFINIECFQIPALSESILGISDGGRIDTMVCKYENSLSSYYTNDILQEGIELWLSIISV